MPMLQKLTHRRGMFPDAVKGQNMRRAPGDSAQMGTPWAGAAIKQDQ